MTDPVLEQGALAQARLIAQGMLSEQGLWELQQSAIAQRNPVLNAFVAVAHDDPARVDPVTPSALTGVCFGVKDNIDVRSLPTHAGLKALRAGPAAEDAPVVARLRQAGLRCIGKLNMHPVALGTTNHNPDFGNALNPHDTSRTPGGSSGGSGVAVAAGLCGLALGTDTMGSVRIPAAHCGVVGFKPGAGVIPAEGVVPLSTLLDCVGVLTRGVADAIAAFAVASGDRSKAVSELVLGLADQTAITAAAITRPPSQLPFAVPGDLNRLALEDPVRAAFDRGIAALRRQGASVVEIDLAAYPFTRLRRAGLVLCETELLTTLAEPLRDRRDELPGDLLAMLDFGASRTGADVARLLAEVTRWGRWLDARLAPFAGLLMPTTGHVAFPMDDDVPHDHADFTAMANMSGGPSISIPLPVAPGDLPVGLQLTGCRGTDWRMLGDARWIELVLKGVEA